jgi:hypothetical protein
MATRPSPEYASTWPDEWTGQPRSGLLLFGTVFIGLLTLGTAAAAVWQAAEGDVGGTLGLAAITVYFGHLSAFCVHFYRGGRHRDDTTGVREESQGLVFRYASAPTYLLIALVVMTLAAMIAQTVASATRTDVKGYVIAVVGGVLEILLIMFLVVMVRLAPGRVVVGPDGIRHRGLTFEHVVPWSAVAGVTARWRQGPVIVIRTTAAPGKARMFGPPALPPVVIISGPWLAGDPALLLRTLAHYTAHPANRPELGTEAALRRIVARRPPPSGGI